MAKIDRYDGDLKAFASESLGTERTVFGDVTQADDLDSNITSDFFRGWGITGVNDAPSKQDFNALGYTLGQLLAYLHQMGIAEWAEPQEYQIGSIVTRSGTLYRCKTADHQSATAPESDGTNWDALFLGATGTSESSGMTQKSITDEFADHVKMQRLTSGADLDDVIESGFYFCGSSGANRPNNLNSGQLIVVQGGGTTITQFFCDYSDGDIYVRSGAPTETGGPGSYPAWRKLAFNENLYGHDQTWQDLTGSRSASVTYTNSTGGPITFLPNVTRVNNDSIFTLYVNGTALFMSGSYASSGTAGAGVPVVVPDGDTYKIEISEGTLESWWELR